jgi:hypothetical protein
MKTSPMIFGIVALEGRDRFLPTAMTFVTPFADIDSHTTCPEWALWPFLTLLTQESQLIERRESRTSR